MMSGVEHKFYLVDYIIKQQGSPYVYKTRMTFRDWYVIWMTL